MAKQSKTKSPKTNGKTFGKWELQEALFNIYDTLQRGMVKFVLLGDIANCLYNKDEELKGNKIVIGVKRHDMTEYAKSTFRSFAPHLDEFEGGYRTEYKGIPVEIQVIDKNWKFLERPDVRFLYNEEFYIPNPFKNYWKVKQLV